MEAAREKGGVVAILEKQLAVQEEEEEAAKRISDRAHGTGIRSVAVLRPSTYRFPGSETWRFSRRSEVLQGVNRRQLLQQPVRVPGNDEIKEAARHLKEVNPNYGSRRIWNAMKEEHPDWTVPEVSPLPPSPSLTPCIPLWSWRLAERHSE